MFGCCEYATLITVFIHMYIGRENYNDNFFAYIEFNFVLHMRKMLKDYFNLILLIGSARP